MSALRTVPTAATFEHRTATPADVPALERLAQAALLDPAVDWLSWL